MQLKRTKFGDLRVDFDLVLKFNHIFGLVGSWVVGIYPLTEVLTVWGPILTFLTFRNLHKERSFIV